MKTRKILALALAVMMVLAMSLAMAEPYNITISAADGDTEAHTYDAFQIFAGVSNLSSETEDPIDPKLGTISWGAAVPSDKVATFISALKAGFTSNTAIQALATDATAGVVAGAISTLNSDPYATDDDNAKTLAAVIGKYISDNSITTTYSGTGTSSVNVQVPGDGYYFIKDKSNPDGDNDEKAGASTRFILEVIGDTAINAKASVPSVSKFVDDENDSTTAEDDITWTKTADYDVNDIIPYQIKGTLPSNYGDYARYNYVFHDTMGTGLTYDTTKGAAKVVLYANEEAYQADVTAKKGYADHSGTDITTSFDTAFSSQQLTISVKDFATTGDDNLGLKKNSNITKDSVIVVYYYAKITSEAVVGNPGVKNDVYLEFSNNPNAGGEGETGNTPKDTNVVFTYAVEVDKVDENLTALNGAAFALLKKISAPTSEQTNAAVTDLTATGVTLTEGTTVYKVGDSDYYLLIKNWATNTTGNTFAYDGIDDGIYLISETVVPTGYNKASDVTFTVSASATEDATSDTGYKISDFTVSGGTFSGSDSGAAATVTEGSNTYTIAADADGSARAAGAIKNNSGATLPSTGGIGTTIFYVLGSVMALGALVLLVTKRRVNVQ